MAERGHARVYCSLSPTTPHVYTLVVALVVILDVWRSAAGERTVLSGVCLM